MTENPFDRLRASLQYVLDCEGDGWQLAHYVVLLGLQKMDPSDGAVASTAWILVPVDQPEYVTDGLVRAAEDMRADAEIGGDD